MTKKADKIRTPTASRPSPIADLERALHRLPVRGTIISTSRFSRGTEEAAFAGGAAPITLIDGDKLIDMLIEHGIGVRKRPVEVLTVDPDAFSDLEGDG